MQRNRRRKNNPAPNQYQSLEKRQLLAGISFNGSTGELFIGGTGGNDVTAISISGTTLSATLTGFATQSFAASSVSKVTFVGVAGNDRFTNNTSVASFAYGNDGDDILTGGTGEDSLNGGRGNDLLVGRDGNDALRGGSSPGLDELIGGNGDDILFGSGDASEIHGGSGADRIYGGASGDTITGGAGDDLIFPGAGENNISAGSGDDYIVSGNDVDIIFGDSGSDRIYSTGGNDQVDGGAGDDFLFGGDGDDTLLGQNGIDLIRGGNGIDTINGGNGVEGNRDRLFGDSGNDIITGLGFSDYIDGGIGNDTINSGGGVDVIYGRDGSDTIDAGAGNDLIVGGQGNDFIEGGDGVDFAQYLGEFDDYTITGEGTLTIIDDVGFEGADELTNMTQLRFSDGDRDAEAPPTAIERVTVRPIIVSNTNGSNTAEFFGSTSDEADIKSKVDDIFAQAEIDILWQTPQTWNNTFANIGNGGTRSTSDLNTIVNSGDNAGVGDPGALVIDMYFVEVAPGFGNQTENVANGLAFLGDTGIGIHIGDNLVSWEGGRAVVASVVAHEIAHNLGLHHVSGSNNLMAQSGNSTLLTPSQISTTLSSNLSVPI